MTTIGPPASSPKAAPININYHQPEDRPHLLTIPIEVRVMIYKLLHEENSSWHRAGSGELVDHYGLAEVPCDNILNLLRTCKQIYEEASPFFFSKMTVIFWPQKVKHVDAIRTNLLGSSQVMENPAITDQIAAPSDNHAPQTSTTGNEVVSVSVKGKERATAAIPSNADTATLQDSTIITKEINASNYHYVSTMVLGSYELDELKDMVALAKGTDDTPGINIFAHLRDTVLAKLPALKVIRVKLAVSGWGAAASREKQYDKIIDDVVELLKGLFGLPKVNYGIYVSGIGVKEWEAKLRCGGWDLVKWPECTPLVPGYRLVKKNGRYQLVRFKNKFEVAAEMLKVRARWGRRVAPPIGEVF